jgi:hypothetical protein
MKAALFATAAMLGLAVAEPSVALAKEDIQTQPPAAGVTKGTDGVLKPKKDPDPGMVVATPNPREFPTPVIPPPGTKNENQKVVPK